MAIYSKKLKGKQKVWAEHYEKITGVEPLYQEDFDNDEMTFNEFAQENIDWFFGWAVETSADLDNYPKEGEDDE